MPWTSPAEADSTILYVAVRALLPDGQGGVADWGRKLLAAAWTGGSLASEFAAVALSPAVLDVLDTCSSAPGTSGFVEVDRLPVIPPGAPTLAGGGTAAGCSVQALGTCGS